MATYLSHSSTISRMLFMAVERGHRSQIDLGGWQALNSSVPLPGIWGLVLRRCRGGCISPVIPSSSDGNSIFLQPTSPHCVLFLVSFHYFKPPRWQSSLLVIVQRHKQILAVHTVAPSETRGSSGIKHQHNVSLCFGLWIGSA